MSTPDGLDARTDETGVWVDLPRGAQDRPVDLVFDEQRIGSFWLERDTVARGAERFWAWPAPLRPHLVGRTRLSLVDHATSAELFAEDVVLGAPDDPQQRITVADGQGNPLGLDKSMRLMRLFADRSAEHLDPLLDSIEDVLTALRSAGVHAFIAYGTLLGAVRQGGFIGHDSDADLGYVSAHDHPADVVRESFRLQRALVDMGYPVTRYSGLAFKIFVQESDGTRRGLDVFGGFLREGVLYLMGEVGHPFEREWIWPLGTASLEGRDLPVPARPERLLAAMYGESWRVPDPAYQFETPAGTRRRLNGWFRGTRVQREEVWDPYYSRAKGRSQERPSDFVRWVRRRERDATTAVDVGCGTGADVAFLAKHGVHAIGLDYSRRAFARKQRKLARRGLPATFRWANLTEVRSALVTGALLSREPGPRVVLARHVADATNADGRANLLRLARMALGGQGRLYLQVLSAPAPGGNPLGVHPIDVDALVAQVEASGGTVVARHDLAGERPGPTDPGATPYLCRLVVQWPQ
ncbi:LicD family protein [Nocardioides dokdonensis FR1436]|uniref:LicD family protein n=1 Tax=Nocardioides dokdonensis FR1436 TaxID=1300347 RepID=A0A1A9GEB1_9ACTN|nr:class I SAM-dependent methyltransferase [Nocardioides dokdonensis]ANH36574.1 LicD family protein [Nocardioides dokdonensis FR1436]